MPERANNLRAFYNGKITLDPTSFPKIGSNSQANKLLQACEAAFEWGGTLGLDGSAESPPAERGTWTANEGELIKAAAHAGQSTANATTSMQWTAANQDAYAAAYGQALATGLEDALAGTPEKSPYPAPASVPAGSEPGIQAIYKAAYGVYGPGFSGAGENTDKATASSLGQSLLIALGLTAVIGAGLWYWSKKEAAHANPSNMKLYQINDGNESVTIDEFLADNQYLDPEDVQKIKSLDVEEVGNFGGGGWAEWKIRRVY